MRAGMTVEKQKRWAASANAKPDRSSRQLDCRELESFEHSLTLRVR
jgi:hypothetical protein